MATINFGIDLGTTNSVIAKCNAGVVEVFRNPLSQKETLPSVVAFRKNRMLVGDKAREYLEKDPDNVVGSFKRKMGTAETYYIRSLDADVTPVELSAHVLRELKTFVHTGETVEAAVITIPAAFDTIQANATKEAGKAAGFRHVVLLQEPIAASLAYVNKQEHGNNLPEGQWLVYDLGGGTFDVAMVKIKDGEMRVMDHEGDNFLGGTDFDALIVEKLCVPYMQQQGAFRDLLLNMRSAKGKYNPLYLQLLQKAEEAKIQLSSAASADLEFETQDDNGEELELCLTIQRQDFETLIEPWVTQTVEMIRSILVRNQISAAEVQFVLMVGGSTLIPYVRERVGKDLGIAVNCNIDPTNCVGVGAAYYAATRNWSKEIDLEKKPRGGATAPAKKIELKMAYQKTSQDRTEYFTALVSGEFAGHKYRIIREDKGYDSGLKELKARIEEDLPLVPNTYNYFRMSVYDAEGNIAIEDLPEIGIAHGKFSVTGQPLPNDICLEVDDLENETTALEVVFRKNEVLPLRRTLLKTVTRTLRKGSDEEILIQLLEGPETSLPAANQPIGHIVITGQKLERDLIKGSDVEITIEISESRDLRITAYLMLTDQEFIDVFVASRRYVHPPKIAEELQAMHDKLHWELLRNGDDESLQARGLPILEELKILVQRAGSMAHDDVTDQRYQFEDQKRKIAQRLSDLTKEQAITEEKLGYSRARKYCQYWVEKYGSEPEKRMYEETVAGEKNILRSNHPARIKDAADRLFSLAFTIRWRTIEFLQDFYLGHALPRKSEYVDQEKATELLAKADEALRNENVYQLQNALSQLWDLLPIKMAVPMKFGTGIG